MDYFETNLGISAILGYFGTFGYFAEFEAILGYFGTIFGPTAVLRNFCIFLPKNLGIFRYFLATVFFRSIYGSLGRA